MSVLRVPRRELVEFLAELPTMQTVSGRQSILFYAGLDELAKRLDLGGSAKTFSACLLSLLSSHGLLTDGSDPLVMFLEALEGQVGPDRIRKLRKIVSAWVDDERTRRLWGEATDGSLSVSDETVRFYLTDYKAGLGTDLLRFLEEMGHRRRDRLVEPLFSPVRKFEEKGAVDVTIENILEDDESLAITGPAGSGKSTALILLALTMLEEDLERVPILILPDDFRLHMVNCSRWTPIEVGECLFASFRRVPLPSVNSAVARAAFRACLNEAKFIFLIDAIDEIDKLVNNYDLPGHFSFLLNSLLLRDKSYQRSQYIVTSRTNRYDEVKIGPWRRYELREWWLPQFRVYFEGKDSLIATIKRSKKLQRLLDRPIMCYFLDCIGEEWLGERVSRSSPVRYRERLVSEPTFLYTRFIAHSLAAREQLGRTAIEFLGAIACKVFLGELLTRTDALEVIRIEIEDTGAGQRGRGARTDAEPVLDSFVGSSLIHRLSAENPYVRFMHESYLEYAVAYKLNRLVSMFEESECLEAEGTLGFKGIEYLGALGRIKPTESVYSYLRDLCCGFLHRRKYPGLTLDFRKLVRTISIIQSNHGNLVTLVGDDKIQNAITMLMQVLRGFLYAAYEDDTLHAEMDAHLEACQSMLSRYCTVDDFVLRSEAACTLVGFGSRRELEEILRLMMKDKYAFQQRKEHIRQIWGFDEYDSDMMDRAREKAWRIIRSQRGFRPELRCLNVFQLAQFSDREEDIEALLKLKREEESKGSESQNDFLIHVIDYSINRIKQNKHR